MHDSKTLLCLHCYNTLPKPSLRYTMKCNYRTESETTNRLSPRQLTGVHWSQERCAFDARERCFIKTYSKVDAVWDGHLLRRSSTEGDFKPIFSAAIPLSDWINRQLQCLRVELKVNFRPPKMGLVPLNQMEERECGPISERIVQELNLLSATIGQNTLGIVVEVVI